MENQPEPQSKPPVRYKWPWFLAAFVLLGILLAILWMSFAVERVRIIRNANEPAQGQGSRQAPSHH
ncbi:MAG TPA: hypothetical protein VHH88_02670 [Verrucomicrobiae bacterium]|nr:hypothetical protein [Verrucomicrobiae bacterium]